MNNKLFLGKLYMGGIEENTINKKIKSNGGEMSKIDALIIVHSEHEGLLSVGNGERCKEGIWLRSRRRNIYQGAALLQPAGGC